MIRIVLAGAIFFAAVCPAVAGDNVSPAAAAAGPAKTEDRDKLVCHQEQVMGSHIERKICYTQAEADLRRQEDQKSLERLQNGYGFNCLAIKQEKC